MTKPPPFPPYPPGYNDKSFFLNNHVTISYLDSKRGYGAIAKNDIPRHTLILAEEPLLKCDEVEQAHQLHETGAHVCQEEDDSFLKTCGLDEARKSLVWHMHDQYCSTNNGETDKEEKRLWGIIRSNAYHNSDHNFQPALYFAAAKLNHSCRPNVGYDFNNWTMRMYTTREIVKGEELFSCYSDVVYHEVGRVRIPYLKRRLGFTCACDACCLSSSTITRKHGYISCAESDRRRKHLKDLAMILTDSLGVTFLYNEDFAKEVKRETTSSMNMEEEDYDYENDDDDLYEHDSPISIFGGRRGTGSSNNKSISGKVRPKLSDLDTLMEYIHLLEEEGIDHDILDCYELAFDLAVFLEERGYMKLYQLGFKCLELYEVTKGAKHKMTKKFRKKLRQAEYAGLT